jgi:hypothetical protein
MKKIVLGVLVITLCTAIVGCSMFNSDIKLDTTETIGSLTYKVNSEWSKSESSNYEGERLFLLDADYGESFGDTITYAPLDENGMAMPLVVLRIRIAWVNWSNDWDKSIRLEVWQKIINDLNDSVVPIEEDSIKYGTYFYENDMVTANIEFTNPDDSSIYRGEITIIANGDETYVIAMLQNNKMSDSSRKLYESVIQSIDIEKYPYSAPSLSSSSGWGSSSSSSGSSSRDYSAGSEWEEYDSNRDGKISDSEFQDAVGDFMDEYGY